MNTAIQSALSGLSSASKRVAVAAENIANQHSTATRVNGVTTNKPYIPKDVVQISLGTGGVRSEIREATNPTVTYPNLDSSETAGDATVSAPNVDIAEEMVKMQIASYDYKANLKAIAVSDKMEQSLLDMLS